MAGVNYENHDRVGYITLNRPNVLNALDDETNGELWEVWNRFSMDDSVDVAVLTGAGRAFCAGADLRTFFLKWENATMLDLRKNIATGFGGGITRGQHRMTKPIIAAVNGHAIGGGLEIALACDIRIASEKAWFASFETSLGLHQGDGGIVRLVAIAGMATAMELALTGREVSAEEALRLGLVSCVVPHDQLMATADRYASMILKNSQRAVRSAKETILDVVGRTIDDALRLETINAYSCLGDFTETKERLDQFYKKKR